MLIVLDDFVGFECSKKVNPLITRGSFHSFVGLITQNLFQVSSSRDISLNRLPNFGLLFIGLF
jgi:hypothetical protein